MVMQFMHCRNQFANCLSLSDSCLAKLSGQSSVGWKFIVKVVMYGVYIMFVLNTILF